MRAKIGTFVTSYNHGKYVKQAVESVLAQSVVPDRVLLIDDGSEDETSEVMRVLASENPRVEFYGSAHIGHIHQYNYALHRLIGGKSPVDFVHLMAADDFLLDKEFYRMALDMMNPEVGFVSGGLIQVGEDGKPPERHADRVECWAPNDLYGVRPAKMILERLRSGNFVNGGCTLCRRDALRSVKQPIYNPAFPFAADYLLWVRILGKGWRGGFIGGSVYAYRRSPSQMTAKRRAPDTELAAIAAEIEKAIGPS